MGNPHVAAHAKRARRLGAHLVFIDESGFLMAPLVRRTLALRGQTPQLLHKIRHGGRGRDKVSVMGALTLSPKRGRLGLYFSNIVNDYFDHVVVAWFVRQLLKHLRGHVIIVWDRGPMHQGPDIRQLQRDYPRLHVEQLPAYAPELNPVECVWSYLKWGRLCNYAPPDPETLDKTVFNELHGLRKDQKRLRGFWQGSDLPMPLALVS
jgi:putative transposase